jgi:DNA-binding Lrp family transcriptional regulator
MTGLSDTEKNILSVAQLDAEQTPTSIAKKLKLQIHTVRYVLAKLMESGIINRLTCVNLARLGLAEYYFVVKLKTRTTSAINRMLEVLKKSDHVVWVLELGGDYHLGIVYLAQSLKDATLFAEQVMEQSRVEIKQHYISIRVSRTYFGVKYLGHKAPVNPVDLGNLAVDETTWDDLDHQILKAIADNSDNKSGSIAKAIGKPEATIHYRVKQLKERGLFARNVFMVNTAKLGMLHYRFHVHTSSPSTDLRTKLYNWGLSHSHVLACFHCIGPWDFEFRTEVETPQQAIAISRELSDKFEEKLSTIEVVPCVALTQLRHYPFINKPVEGKFFR